jgi:2-succinyl-5-enolpyruvyl-6-hydroxy-3-cyclohexene-1-carboxylate synthase
LVVTIVLLNNDGGGIFHFLPVATQTDAFETHVATPHGLPFEHAAALYDCRYERAESAAGLRDALARAMRAEASSVIEVRTDRERNLALHRRIAAAVIPPAAAAAPEA